MASSKVITIVTLCVLISVYSSTVAGYARLNTRQLSTTFKSQKSNNVCTYYMESCIPWETKCCDGMECLNVVRGYCLYPMENCMCMRAHFDSF